MFDPSIGQWFEEDPIGFLAGDGNLRRYVGNNATNGVDPTGLAEYVIKGGKSEKKDKFALDNKWIRSINKDKPAQLNIELISDANYENDKGDPGENASKHVMAIRVAFSNVLISDAGPLDKIQFVQFTRHTRTNTTKQLVSGRVLGSLKKDWHPLSVSEKADKADDTTVVDSGKFGEFFVAGTAVMSRATSKTFHDSPAVTEVTENGLDAKNFIEHRVYVDTFVVFLDDKSDENNPKWNLLYHVEWQKAGQYNREEKKWDITFSGVKGTEIADGALPMRLITKRDSSYYLFDGYRAYDKEKDRFSDPQYLELKDLPHWVPKK